MTGGDDTAVAVDFDSLGTFLDFVSLEIDGNVSPAVTGVHTEFVTGVAWGGQNVHGAVVAKSHKSYTDAQWLMMSNMLSYMTTGLALLKTMNYLLVTYKTTEEMAKASVANVQTRMTEQLAAEQRAFLAAQVHAAQGGSAV